MFRIKDSKTWVFQTLSQTLSLKEASTHEQTKLRQIPSLHFL